MKYNRKNFIGLEKEERIPIPKVVTRKKIYPNRIEHSHVDFKNGITVNGKNIEFDYSQIDNNSDKIKNCKKEIFDIEKMIKLNEYNINKVQSEFDINKTSDASILKYQENELTRISNIIDKLQESVNKIINGELLTIKTDTEENKINDVEKNKNEIKINKAKIDQIVKYLNSNSN